MAENTTFIVEKETYFDVFFGKVSRYDYKQKQNLKKMPNGSRSY